MYLPRPIQNLITFSNSMDQNQSQEFFNLSATIITPEEQITLQIPTGMAKMYSFGMNHSDAIQIQGHLPPGVYQNKILPNRANLSMEVVRRVGLQQTVVKYRAIPQGDSDPTMAGQNTALADLSRLDDINLMTFKFQLVDPGFALLRVMDVSDHMLMTTPKDLLYYQLLKYGKKLNLQNEDLFRGVDIELPYDNDQIFPVIVIPTMPIIKLAEWVQNNAMLGFYSKGLGSYYRRGMWYIYPLLDCTRYAKARKVANIYRLPEDVFPTLNNTWWEEDKVLTILGTGGGDNQDGSDLLKMNKGSGKRVIHPDAITGDVGRYYAKGQGMTTRADSLSEYKTSDRGNEEEYIPMHGEPTANMAKMLTQNARADGSIVSINWHNSNVDKLEPGMPCRFYFMSGSETLMYREGTVIGARGEAQQVNQQIQKVFRENAVLELFISNQAFDAV